MTNTRRMYKNNKPLYLTLLLALCCGLACQNPIQPSTDTSGKGFPTTVNVIDQGANLLPGSAVQWKVLNGIDAEFHNMPTKNAANDGSFLDIIPVPITDDTTHVVFRVIPPSDPAFQGVQKDGNVQIDTVKGYCQAKTYTFQLVRKPEPITKCADVALPACPPIHLLAQDPTKLLDTAATMAYSNNLGAALTLSITSVASPITDVAIYIRINGGAMVPFTGQTIANGQTFQIFFVFVTTAATATGITKYTVTINGDTPTNKNCFTCGFDLTTEFRKQTVCDCPTSSYRFNKGIDSVCVGDTKLDTIDLSSIQNTNALAGCLLKFTLAPSSVLIPEISFVAASPTPSDNLIPPGAGLGKIFLTVSPTANKLYTEQLIYFIDRIAPDGTVTRCDSQLHIQIKGYGDIPSCAIDPTSSFFANDTLFQVLDEDSIAGREVCIQNLSKGCPITITSATLAGANPSPFHVTTGIPLTINPNKEGCVTVNFTPQDADVWPFGRGPGINPIDTFRATLTWKTSSGCDSTIPIIGIVIPAKTIQPCQGLYDALHDPSGIVLGQKGSILLKDDSTGGLSIWVQAINGTTSATLTSGTASNRYVAFHLARKGFVINYPTTLCDSSLSLSRECVPANFTPQQYTTIPDVQVGDVILFEYVYRGTILFGALLVQRIGSVSQTGTSEPAVCLQVCFPI
jgi:hypothetical protein